VELNKTTTRFVANGHQRWSAAREEKIRAAVRENEPVGFFGKIRRWFKIEAGILHGQKGNEKSSPKILW
jgi:hypothetical protein